MFLPLEVWLGEPTTPSQTSEDVPWDYIVVQHFTGADFDTAMSIIACESAFDPEAANPTSTARGGWQFLKGTWEWVQADSGLDLDDWPDGPYDPYQATAAARWLKDTAGWSQWACHGVRPGDWFEPVTVDLVSEGRPGRH